MATAKAIDELSDALNSMQVSSQGYVSKSQRDKPQLVFQGHRLRICRENSDSIRWRCVRSDVACKYFCSTKGCEIGKVYDVYAIESEHTETPDPTALRELEYRRFIKVLIFFENQN